MIIIGDIASPDRSTTDQLASFFTKQRDVFGSKRVIANLEGLLSDRNPMEDNQPVLSNHTSLPASLKEVIDPVFCMANNHVLDLPGEYDSTLANLRKENIPFGGTGRTFDEAKRPIIFKEGNQEIILFSACWDFLLYNQKNPTSGVYVGELNEVELLKEVSHFNDSHKDAAIVVYLHWSLDLESLPFPMYRQFSRALIDAGAAVVAGTHAHCVQGGEKYRNGYIVYGLGNFFMPHHLFVNGKLAYPVFASVQLALEWDPATARAVCHWVKYEYDGGKHSMHYLGGEPFEESEKLFEFSPFQGMSDREYRTYFKKNRRKRVLIPVYTDYRKRYKNMVFTRLLKGRATIARSLAKLKLISWQH